MKLVESIERGLAWLATPRWIPGRLEMETQRGKRLEIEVVSFAMRVPIPGGAVVRIPVFVAIMPAGSSPIQSARVPSEQNDEMNSNLSP
jgi:hypothetical protein